MTVALQPTDSRSSSPLDAGNPLAAGEDRGGGQRAELAAVNESLQARPESVQGCAAANDQVVADFNLREKETMLTSMSLCLSAIPHA